MELLFVLSGEKNVEATFAQVTLGLRLANISKGS